jgi:hypothetical protein
LNAEGRLRANAHAFFAREHIATIDTLLLLEALIASASIRIERMPTAIRHNQDTTRSLARSLSDLSVMWSGDKRKSS